MEEEKEREGGRERESRFCVYIGPAGMTSCKESTH